MCGDCLPSINDDDDDDDDDDDSTASKAITPCTPTNGELKGVRWGLAAPPPPSPSPSPNPGESR